MKKFTWLMLISSLLILISWCHDKFSESKSNNDVPEDQYPADSKLIDV